MFLRASSSRTNTTIASSRLCIPRGARLRRRVASQATTRMSAEAIHIITTYFVIGSS